jgi:hypothetical protein
VRIAQAERASHDVVGGAVNVVDQCCNSLSSHI